MAKKVVLHRLQDWAVSRHLLPVLRAAGVPDAALGYIHYFHAAGVVDLFAAVEEGAGFPESVDALLLASSALADFGCALGGIRDTDRCTSGFRWSSSEEAFVAAAKKRRVDVVFARGTARAGSDRAGAALDQEGGARPSAELFEKLKARKGDKDGSRRLVVLSFYGRLEEVFAAGERVRSALAAATGELPRAQRKLAALALAAVCPADPRAEGRRADVEAMARNDRELAKEMQRAFRRWVLADARAPLGRLLEAFEEARYDAMSAPELAAFRARWDAAVARDEHTLEQWVFAYNRDAIDEATFDAGVVAPFRRAVAAGFRDERGAADEDSFSTSARVIGAADPDLALAGLLGASEGASDYALKELLEAAQEMPREGYSEAARAAAAAHFSDPARRSAARRFAPLFAAWGVAARPAPPPALESIDAVLEDGTDVATLIVGSLDAVEKIIAVEGVDDWGALVRESGSIGVELGEDGGFRVRLVGEPDAAAASAATKGARRIGTAPLCITGDALALSGITGANPNIPFPSGTYAAEMFGHRKGPLTLTVLIRRAAEPPAWPFDEDELPGIEA